MYCGVGKSGSPAPKPITGRPAALSAFALASTARVADSAMAPRRAETRECGICGSWSSVTRTSWQIRARVGSGFGAPWRPISAACAGSADGFDRSVATTYTRPLVVDNRHDEVCPEGASRRKGRAQRSGCHPCRAVAQLVAHRSPKPVSYTHLRAHETRHDLVCRLLLEKKK